MIKMPRLACAIFTTSLVCLNGGAALAWGQEGHSIIAEIAQRTLTAPVAAKVHEIMGGNASLASISSWADDVREDRPETYNWHFVDIPLSNDHYVPKRDCVDGAKGDCVIAEIQRATKTLSCEGDDVARREALQYLVHFVGDIHQPFHTVEENHGENDLHVVISFKGLIGNKSKEQTNLHSVWDSGIIRRTVWDWGAYVSRLEDGWLKDHSTTVISEDVVAWAEETHAVAKKAIEWEPENNDLGDAYYNEALPIVDQQLSLAGRRLAAVINRALGKTSDCTQ